MRGDLSGKLATFWLESKTLFVKSAEEFFAKSSVRRHLSIWQRPERLFSSLLFWGEKRYLKSKISLRPPRKLTYAHFECRWWGRLACITFQSHEQRDTGSPPKTLYYSSNNMAIFFKSISRPCIRYVSCESNYLVKTAISRNANCKERKNSTRHFGAALYPF